MAAPRIAIIGFGFSGLMVTAQLVRTVPGCILYIIAPDLNGLGLAYGTENPDHLLNVPAGRMGAFPERIDGFLAWLSTAEGALAKQRLKLTKEYGTGDFVPRALYGAYLSDIWRTAQQDAAQHGCQIKLVETTATRLRTEGELAVLTARGDAIAVDRVVLAAGNEMKPILPRVKSAQVMQNPWAKDLFRDAAQWASPVVLVGAGLTAVDTVLSLTRAGYAGEIIVCSRHGRWPATHQPTTATFHFDAEELFAQKDLQQLLRYVRSKIDEVGEWRVVIDALRPHTIRLWQKLSVRDQKRFVRRLLSLWNVHRHRMSPEVQPALKVLPVRKVEGQVEGEVLQLALHAAQGVQRVTPSRVINCTGGELDVTRSMNPLLKQALADTVLEPHANGLGVAVDPYCRAWGILHPNLYVIGSWVTGQFLESTAVPELRTQAAEIARHIAGNP